MRSFCTIKPFVLILNFSLKGFNSLTNKPTDQPHIEAAEVISGS